MAVAVHLENVCKSFGTNRVVDNISITIQPGELFFLLGPSGCGKTTLLRCLAGFYIPESGTIRFNTEDITQLPPEKRDTGMVFQSYALWPHLTIAQNIGYALELRGDPPRSIAARVAELLAFVEMSGLQARFPAELSGGQQQRIAVARSLAANPSIVLFDEPLSNLDAKLRESMRFELRRVHREVGLTGLYVTHSQEEAFALGDRVAVMRDGRIEQIAPPEALYTTPRTEFVARFVGLANILHGVHEASGGAGAAVLRLDRGAVIRATARTAVTRGEQAVVMVRPEHLRLQVAPPWTRAPGENLLEGQLTDIVFSGAFHDCFVQCGPERLRIQVPGGVHLAPGASVAVAFAAHDAVVLDPTPASAR